MGDEEGATKTTNKERRRTKRQRENGSQTDDETLQDGGATMWQKEVNKKLDSLLTIVPLVEELKEELKMMKEENKSLQTALKWANDEIEALKQNQMNAAEELSEVTEKVIKADREVDQLVRRNIKLEAQSRRNNIKFFNVRENEAESSFSDTEKVLRKLFVDKLKMPKEEAADVEFERVHRIPTRRPAEYDPGKPRPIIAKLSFYKDKSRIFQYAKNIDRSTKIGVAEDYPKEIDNIRKELHPVQRKAKKENTQAAFNVDKLIINGEIYRGPETKSLPFYARILNA